MSLFPLRLLRTRWLPTRLLPTTLPSATALLAAALPVAVLWMTGLLATGLLTTGLLAGLARPAGAEEPREIWRFTDGDVERVVDVTDMPPYVREAVTTRLLAQGYRRVLASTGAEERVEGRNLEEDARTLIQNDGRFPGRTVASAAGDPALRAMARTAASMIEALTAHVAESSTRRAARRLAAALGRAFHAVAEARAPRVLGAVVSIAPEDGWRVEEVPAGCAAALLGLEVGDRVVEVDGHAADREALLFWEDPGSGVLQRSLRVLRREGRFETWDLEVFPALPGPVLNDPVSASPDSTSAR